jgi:AraC-like DNA-binding protein
MTACLVGKHLSEMVVEFPTPSLSQSNRLEESRFVMDNRCAGALLTEFLCRREKGGGRCGGHAPRGENDKFVRTKEILEQRYRNPPSLHELSLMVGTNECTLKNGFKKLFGTTVFGYLFDYRMMLACRYLWDTDKAIQEIADLVGYEHQSHFSTAFKRKFCVSPQQYRASSRSSALRMEHEAPLFRR